MERDPLLAAEEGHDAAIPPSDAEANPNTSATGRAWRWVVAKARELKREVLALYLAMDDPRTPWVARVGAAIVVGYALSPFDLIPDFIPVCRLEERESPGGGEAVRGGESQGLAPMKEGWRGEGVSPLGRCEVQYF